MGVVILQRLLLQESWSLPSNMSCLVGTRQELDEMGARRDLWKRGGDSLEGRERERKSKRIMISPLEYRQPTRRKITHQNIQPTRIKITHQNIDSTKEQKLLHYTDSRNNL